MPTEDDAVAEVMARERESLRPEVRASAEALDRLLDPEFREIGASGRLWTRAAAIEAVPTWPRAAPILDEDMEGRRVADDLVLLTYVSDHDGQAGPAQLPVAPVRRVLADAVPHRDAAALTRRNASPGRRATAGWSRDGMTGGPAGAHAPAPTFPEGP